MNFKSAKYLLLLLVLITSACKNDLPSEKESNVQLSTIDSIITSEHDADNFHGGVIIGTKDQVFFEKYVGIADRSKSVAINEDTKFDMASLNKSFVGYLIINAQKEGLLTVNDLLVDHLAQYIYKGEFDSTITLHQMLSHCSGLPDYGVVSDSLKANNFKALKGMHFSNAEYIDFISQLEPVAKPGEQFQYSNFEYHLLSLIIEDVYNKSFNSVLQQKICKPFGLNATLNSTDNYEEIQNLAIGYNYNQEKGEWLPNEYIDLTIGRRIFCTVSDLFKWGQIQSELGREFPSIHTNHLDNLTNQISYGYGWVIYNEGDSYRMGVLDIDKPYIIHGGSTEGYKSILVNINNGELVVALMANSGSRTNETELLKKIVKSYYLNK